MKTTAAGTAITAQVRATEIWWTSRSPMVATPAAHSQPKSQMEYAAGTTESAECAATEAATVTSETAATGTAAYAQTAKVAG
jgi:hypothetical protein